MKRFDLLGTITFLILAYGIFSGNSCFKDDTVSSDTKCGDASLWYSSNIHVHTPTHTELAGNRRYFIFEDMQTPTDICKDEHVTVHYYVVTDVTGKQIDSLNIIGKASWWLTAREKRLDWNASTQSYEGVETDLGLKQGVKEGEPASVGLQIHVNFPTRGDYASDVAYFDSIATSVDISLNYHKFKK